MLPHPRHTQTLDQKTHDILLDWLQKQYGISDDWRILYLNGTALGRLNTNWYQQIKQDWSDKLTETPDGIFLQTNDWPSMGAKLQHTALQWKQHGLLHGWRGEQFDVRSPAGDTLFTLERAAFRPFGLTSSAVHLNGLVPTEQGWHFWIGRRSPYKAVDPDKLDNLVGGGISSGETPHEAILRESEEEAGLTPRHLAGLQNTSEIHSIRPVARGIHDEILHIFDIILPPTVHPKNQDGEVADFQLMSIPQIIDAMLTRNMMHDAQLVTLDAFRRHGLLDPRHPLTARIKNMHHTAQPDTPAEQPTKAV